MRSWLPCLTCALAGLACSADPKPNAGPVNPSGGTGGSGIGVADARAGDEVVDAETCAGEITTATTNPLDIFIMLDQSASMSFFPNQSSKDNKWQAVTKAIALFVRQPNFKDVSVGIQYFAQMTGTCRSLWCTSDGDCGPGCGPCVPGEQGEHAGCTVFNGETSCNPDDYAKAEVPIAPLPGNTQAIIDSMSAHWPFSDTPTAPALQGALAFTSSWASAHPDHVVVTILATDGMPDSKGCEHNDIQTVADIAASAFMATPSIRTYAIGIGSSSDDVFSPDAGHWSDNLERIAVAGGTGKAFIVKGNVVDPFVSALNRIRGTALGCAFLVPDGMGKPLDLHQVNVRYTKGNTTSPMYIPKVGSSSNCGALDGWYYDDERQPTRIVACPATCNELSDDFSGKVEIQVGCGTIVR
jgi:hypothetical protein